MCKNPTMDSSITNDYIGTYLVEFFLLQIFLWNVYEITKNSRPKLFSITIIPTLMAIILFVALLVVLIPIFIIYRRVLYLILTVRHGSKFRGMVGGGDAVYTWSETSQSTIQCLMVLQDTTKGTGQEFYQSARQTFSKFSQIPKFGSSFRKFCGFSYELCEELDLDDCIRPMKTMSLKNEKIEWDELVKFLNECESAPLSENGKNMWQILIGTQPINWKNDENVYYPVLQRFHHGICDGITLEKLLLGWLTDNQTKTEMSKSPKKPEANSLFNFIRRTLWVAANVLRVLALVPASLYGSMWTFRQREKNLLQGPPLSGKRVIAMRSETSSEYFEKVKRIKKKIPGVSFPEILVTAYSASLTKYLQKNSTSRPESIAALIPVDLEATKLTHLQPGSVNIKELKICNNFSSMSTEIPIFFKDESGFCSDTPLLNRLKLVARKFIKFKNSVDYQVNYLISILWAFVPHPLVRFALSIMKCTAIASILPGPQTVAYNQGSLIIEDTIVWLPHSQVIGIGLVVFTYNSRLRIGLSVDKALISSQDDVQSITDGIYDCIDLLEKEIDSLSSDYLKTIL